MAESNGLDLLGLHAEECATIHYCLAEGQYTLRM